MYVIELKHSGLPAVQDQAMSSAMKTQAQIFGARVRITETFNAGRPLGRRIENTYIFVFDSSNGMDELFDILAKMKLPHKSLYRSID